MTEKTSTKIDIPYLITDPLPQIFGSQLCRKTKPIFLSKSVPDLSQICWVSRTEDEILQAKTDEALDYLYDLEVTNFYEEARKKAADARLIQT